MSREPETTPPTVTDPAECWRAIVERDPQADGTFFYSVRTTGIYCRPSCASRRPRRENVRFHRSCQEAELAGFRPCKRCRPHERASRSPQAAAIIRACRLIEQSRDPLPTATLAQSVGMSAAHFHRTFRAHMNITPKQYSQAHRNQRVRTQLAVRRSVTAAILEAGYESPNRCYATAAATLGMTPGRFRAGGAGAVIRFAVGTCSLGSILVAATDVGICTIALGDEPELLVRELQDRFPRAEFAGGDRAFEALVAQVVGLVEHPQANHELPLDIRGTAFQQRVWQELRRIPLGQTTTYRELARRIGAPTAIRAVAGANAANPLAVAIPCHRVVRTDGSLAGYRWGVARKAQLLERERRKARP